MGQADVNVNLWLKDTKRFADLFNAILFHGETVILPENLHPSPETTAVSLQDAQGKNVVKKQYRDIIMNWQDQALLMLLAVESQTAIHYAAPLKVMLYDSMEYAEQVRVKWKERPPRLSSAEFLSRFQKNDKLSHGDYFDLSIRDRGVGWTFGTASDVRSWYRKEPCGTDEKVPSQLSH